MPWRAGLALLSWLLGVRCASSLLWTKGKGEMDARSSGFFDPASRGTPADARIVPEFGVVYGAHILSFSEVLSWVQKMGYSR